MAWARSASGRLSTRSNTARASGFSSRRASGSPLGYKRFLKTAGASSSDWTATEEAIRRVSPERQAGAWQETLRRLSALVSRTDVRPLWKALTVALLRHESLDFDRADEILLEVLGQAHQN
jgi:hypothetical protein